MHSHICDFCVDSGAESQIKAGCGHLMYVCNQCRIHERQSIAHNPCNKCNGKLTGDQAREEEQNYQDYLEEDCYPYDPDDDLDLLEDDDIGRPEPGDDIILDEDPWMNYPMWDDEP